MKNKISQAVITLGGKGTRLESISNGIPKPLIIINGESTLERAIKKLSNQGINEFIWLLHYKKEFFLKQSSILSEKYSVKIYCFEEKVPLGDAGGLLKVLAHLKKEFVFLSGDLIFDFDLERMICFHKYNNSDITLCTHTTTHPEDSDCIVESPSKEIIEFCQKFDKEKLKNAFLGNAGIAIIKKKVIEYISFEYSSSNNLKLSFFSGIAIYATRNNFKVLSYNTSEYIKDMGTPARILDVKYDLNKKVVENKSYLKTQKALFLDRDNTIIHCPENKYINKIEEIKILAENVEMFSEISRSYDLVVIISNQPQIAMGMIDMQSVINLNGYLVKECLKYNLLISCFYFCPHHIDSGYKKEISALKYSCFCRKPSPGLFLRAAFERNIDLKSSLMIGDSWRDEQSAKNLEMEFINVNGLKKSQNF